MVLELIRRLGVKCGRVEGGGVRLPVVHHDLVSEIDVIPGAGRASIHPGNGCANLERVNRTQPPPSGCEI